MRKANALFGETTIKIMPYNGQGENETHTYLDFAKAFEKMFYSDGITGKDSEVYEAVYGEALREKKEREVIKAEKLKKEETKQEEPQEKRDGQKESVQNQKETDQKQQESVENPEKTDQRQQENVQNQDDKEEEEQIPGQMEVKDYPELMPETIPNMNPPEPPVHEITEDVVQEGEMVGDILKSGDVRRIMDLLKAEFKEPECGWEKWKKKVVNLDEH